MARANRVTAARCDGGVFHITQRELCWTESLAVGSSGFLEKIRPLILSRRETEIMETDTGTWVLKEAEIPYGQKKGPKNDPKIDFQRVPPRICL
jgi:hypothetical protein